MTDRGNVNSGNGRTAGMILAAGLGTRLAPLTDSIPKALVEVHGIPMLERVIRNMCVAGIEHIVVNIHHHADKVIAFLENLSFPAVNISVSDERSELLDTGGALNKAMPFLEDYDNVIVHNADILTDINLGEMLRHHARTEADATLLTSERASSRRLYFESNGLLRGWKNLNNGKVLPQGFDADDKTYKALAFGGVHILSAPTLSALYEYGADRGAFSVIPFYIEKSRALDIRAYNPPLSEYQWFDIGSLTKLDAAQSQFIE